MQNNHGGRRPGAGRKPIADGPTIVMRVPRSQASAVHDLLATLRERRSHEARDNVVAVMEFAHAEQEARLPLFTSKVAAGFPASADDHVDKRMNPSEYLVSNDDDTFFVRVRGDSMIDAGIFEGDVLVVDRARVPQIGDIVLAVLDGEFTVKTLGKSKQHARLIPANRHYPVIEVKAEQAFEIWGVVTGSMRKFK